MAVLGCINEYCENKHIKTIIVANEEKILGKNIRQEVDEEQADDSEIRTISKMQYSEIKEKIVVRTIKNIPDYEGIITEIISEYRTKEEEYKDFLIENKMNLINVFVGGRHC